jgi:hypothetical protein
MMGNAHVSPTARFQWLWSLPTGNVNNGESPACSRHSEILLSIVKIELLNTNSIGTPLPSCPLDICVSTRVQQSKVKCIREIGRGEASFVFLLCCPERCPVGIRVRVAIPSSPVVVSPGAFVLSAGCVEQHDLKAELTGIDAWPPASRVGHHSGTLPLFLMPLWLPRSTPLALVAVTRRNHAIHPRIITYLQARHSLLIPPNPGQAWMIPRFQSTSITTDSSSPPPSPNPKAPKNTKSAEPVISRAWKKVKHEAQHYWHGSKLLAKEVRISARLQRKILQGETLTRRERRQVRRTSVLSMFEFQR